MNRDPISLLQSALPIEETIGEQNVGEIRSLQKLVEEMISQDRLHFWEKLLGNEDVLFRKVREEGSRKALLKPVAAERKEAAEAVLKQMEDEFPKLEKAINYGAKAGVSSGADTEAAADTSTGLRNIQKFVGDFEELLIPPGYVTPVPADYKDLPQLQGRAVVEMKLKRTPNSVEKKKYTLNDTIFPEAKFTLVIDGYSAPVSAGNFIDLVDKGLYSGMKIQRADGFIVQTGDTGDEQSHGYKEKGKLRTIPLEVGIKGRKEGLYGETIDEARLVGAQVKIPFQADGTLSLARYEFENDTASSQWFLFIFESDMTPAGKNMFDGRYGAFGYTVEGDGFLRQIREGDEISEIKVVSGLDKLVRPA